MKDNADLIDLTINLTDGATDVDFDDEESPAEFPVGGRATPVPQQMAYQIDSGSIHPIAIAAPLGATFVDWSITLTDLECPVVGGWYTLAVFAYDMSGSYPKSRRFQRRS